MTGTPTVSNPVLAAYAVVLIAAVTGFAIYDLFKKRVPNKALAFSAPCFLAAPVMYSWALSSSAFYKDIFTEQLLLSIFGAILGFAILLCAALLSKGGCGVGGGDIKLMGLLGFALGPYGAMGTLCIASILCIPAALFCRWRAKANILSLPFVPFLAIGCSIVLIFQIL